MPVRRSAVNVLLPAAFVLALGAFCPSAWGATAAIDKGTINGGEADFGTGGHYLGSPSGPYTVTWDYSVNSAGVLVKTAHIQGYLYVDKLFGGGCARLKILYQNLSGVNVTTQTSQFCGPGGDANNQSNQQLVDASRSGSDIARVRLITGAGSSLSTIQDGSSATWYEPQIVAQLDTLDNGTWTYQLDVAPQGLNIFPSEFFPSAYGSMDATVNGLLNAKPFALLVFPPRVVFDYFDANGALIDRDVWDVDEGFSPGRSRFNVANIFKVRVRLGEVSQGVFINVVGRTYSFGPAVGDAECTPFVTTAVVNDLATTSLRWTVPGAANWRSLDTIDIRLIDDAGEILQVRWNQAANSFVLFNPDSVHYEQPVVPGNGQRFERPEVAMLLSDTSVVGSGPTGPSVVLNLGLRFKPGAGGRTFRVEARASDKSGTAQGWAAAGSITVLPKH
jgi:hypothetical protein